MWAKDEGLATCVDPAGNVEDDPWVEVTGCPTLGLQVVTPSAYPLETQGPSQVWNVMVGVEPSQKEMVQLGTSLIYLLDKFYMNWDIQLPLRFVLHALGHPVFL